ncbi:MAG TPA: transglutaminase-like domain-containing protein [Isosphaeraceae bacterium]|nr:transglutaminase-like domain-containing protein [Isosphaeraceae bacterium]
MRSPFAGSPEFERLLRRDARPDLTRIALEIARDAYPDLEPGPYLERIEALAARVRDRAPAAAKARQVLGQINWVLFVEEGFQGNTEDYYDPKNSYLNQVIERKTGIPISLSVLYRAVAHRLGLVMEGVNLPAHFMLRVDRGDETIFVDPFHAGALLDRQGCERRVAELVDRPVVLSDLELAPCGLDLVVTRMLRNLKAIYLRGHDLSTALPVQRRLAALNPDDPLEQRDLGMLCLQLDRPADAIAPLQSLLDARPEPEDADVIRALLRAARREVATWN